MLRILAVLAFLATAIAAEPAAMVQVGPNPSAVAFFEQHVRPVLAEHCFECHAGGKRRGGLHVDSLGALLEGGGDRGPAIIPGDVRASPLLQAVRWEGDEEQHMPPKAQLPAAAIHDLERWVEIGAPWPDASAAAPVAPPAPPRPPLLGRLHPLIVHTPIACLLLAVLAELLVLLRGPAWRPATTLLVAVGAAGAAAAVLSGTWLAGQQDPGLLQRHQVLGWMSLCGALTAAGMLILGHWVPMRRWPLLAVLALTAVLVSITGHFGGQMSWGLEWFAL